MKLSRELIHPGQDDLNNSPGISTENPKGSYLMLTPQMKKLIKERRIFVIHRIIGTSK